MKTLLVPLDFSDASEKVVGVAGDLAKAMEGRVVLLHIVEPVATYMPVGASMDVIATAPPPLEPEDTSAPQQRLDTLAGPLRKAGIETEAVATIGLAVDDILSQAESRQAHFIVLGSHGHGALYHLFSGSVVTGVLKRSTCPVIVVPIKKEK